MPHCNPAPAAPPLATLLIEYKFNRKYGKTAKASFSIFFVESMSIILPQTGKKYTFSLKINNFFAKKANLTK